MNGKNTGIKVTLVILVILCLMMMGEITTLNDEVEKLRYERNNMENRLVDVEQVLYDLQAQNESKRLVDINYVPIEPDWENGVVKFDFNVSPNNISENTRVIIGNTKEKVELKRSGNDFIGTVEYPITTEYYETTVYVYEGDIMLENEVVDWLGAGDWAAKRVAYKDDFYVAYGNDRLTVAGTLTYKLNDSEQVKNAKLIFKDSVVELNNHKEGTVEFNFSEELKETEDVEKFDLDRSIYIEELYVELEMESGKIYHLYPVIDANLWYEVGEEDGMEEGKSYSIHQTEQLSVILPEGTSYDMGIKINDGFYEY